MIQFTYFYTKIFNVAITIIMNRIYHVFINHVITSITNYIDYYGNIITNVLLIIYLRIFTYSNIPPQT